MASICTRCALRLQRAAQSQTRQATHRAFSQTSKRAKHHGLPTFAETSTPELDDILLTLRNKHLIPANLHKSERRLIFGTKYRQQLLDNPQTALVGDEEVPLTWIDRRKEIPSRNKLFVRALELMSKGARDEYGGDWKNLTALLTALKGVSKSKGHEKRDVREERMGRIVRKVAEAGHLEIVIHCLKISKQTGLSLKQEDVLENVVWAMHHAAQKAGWSEEAVTKSLKHARAIGLLLESEQHGGGAVLREDDPRTRPEVVGVFLELSAVFAYRYGGGKDEDGSVKMYAERLLSCIGEHAQPPSRAPAPTGPQMEMLHGVPIWHGLMLAENILGRDLPQPQLAKKIRQDYEAGLEILAQAIEAQTPAPGSYGEQALVAWKECVRE
ncbi:hypothetical protein BAUCODRAFT_112632 [Baudoinia panamericana UAMH 10762]|uniref:Uncharacterized protein n=1 Tax=Baudoinia panamericana (strain UAMH 10762) TaxID=717646 RepID=M2N5D0_BAUPA|nr:uncharacterized protein BAUCODRAFT_112632 [Baudoinia panamericana UAMH 10762]EMC93970.1 hypothetical protein BAUCODRAFT_112632 [Baudoinia panamericana UAMH 10762]